MKRFAIATLALLLIGGIARGQELKQATPESVGLSSEKLHKVDGIVGEMIEKKKLAGAIVMVAKDGQIAFTGVYGKMDLEADKPMKEDAIFRIY